MWMCIKNAVKLHVQVFLKMNTWMFETCRRHYKLKQSCKKVCILLVLITSVYHNARFKKRNVLMLCCREVPLVEPGWGTPRCSNGRRTITTIIIINKPVRREVSFLARLCSDWSCRNIIFLCVLLGVESTYYVHWLLSGLDEPGTYNLFYCCFIRLWQVSITTLTKFGKVFL